MQRLMNWGRRRLQDRKTTFSFGSMRILSPAYTVVSGQNIKAFMVITKGTCPSILKEMLNT